MDFSNLRCCQKCESNTLILMLNTWALPDPIPFMIKSKTNSNWIILFNWLIIQNHSEILICFHRSHWRDAERQIWQANYRHACIGVIFSVWLCCALCSHTTWQKKYINPSLPALVACGRNFRVPASGSYSTLARARALAIMVNGSE